MPRRRPRGLRPEEKALWDRVKSTATPLSSEPRPEASYSKPDSTPEASGTRAKPVEPIQPFTIGAKAGSAAHPLPPVPGTPPVRMDRRAYDKMRRGKSRPDGRIDLHGKTVDDARSSLIAYLLSAHAQGKRLVLVITGKGRHQDDDGPIPERKGVLRQSLPHWLSTPPLSSIVLDHAEAHRKHGGSGAFYVYLRRRA